VSSLELLQISDANIADIVHDQLMQSPYSHSRTIQPDYKTGFSYQAQRYTALEIDDLQRFQTIYRSHCWLPLKSLLFPDQKAGSISKQSLLNPTLKQLETDPMALLFDHPARVHSFKFRAMRVKDVPERLQLLRRLDQNSMDHIRTLIVELEATFTNRDGANRDGANRDIAQALGYLTVYRDLQDEAGRERLLIKFKNNAFGDQPTINFMCNLIELFEPENCFAFSSDPYAEDLVDDLPFRSV
jgi:hypothetical protein